MACKGGCGCKNDSTYNGCQEEFSCGSCLGAGPCAYVIQHTCPLPGSGYDGETPLWLECLFGNVYSMSGGQSNDGTSCADSLGGSVPCSTDVGDAANDYVNNGTCEDGTREPGDSPTGNVPRQFGVGRNPSGCEGNCCSGCGIDETQGVWRLYVSGDVPPGTPGCPGTDDCGGGATAWLVYSREELVEACNHVRTPLAIYGSVSDWQCQGRNTMRISGYYQNPPDPDTDNLPPQLCVSAYATDNCHPCRLGGGTTNDICDCEDAGWCCLTIPVSFTCNTTSVEDVAFQRYFDCPFDAYGSSDSYPGLCEHADFTWPSAPCGVFAGTVGNGCGGALCLLYCDGSAWKLEAWCVSYVPASSPPLIDTVTLVDTITVSRSDPCGCPFVFTDDVPAIDMTGTDCCDAACCVPCDMTGVPTTLNMDITGPGNGSGTVTLGAGSSYCGTILLSNGDNMSVAIDPATCAFLVGCNAVPCVSFNCGQFVSTFSPTTCDPFDLTITAYGGGFFCAACSSGTYTIHIYE